MAPPVLFDRTVRLVVARPLRFFGIFPNALEVTDHRVSFSIEKTLEATPNAAEIAVYNLAAKTRDEFHRRPLHVRFEVGYDNDLRLLLQGDVRYDDSRHEGTEWVTRLLVGDGDRAFRYARVNRAFRGGVTVRAAVREAAAAMGLSVPTEADALAEFEQQFAAGLALDGPASTELTRVLSPRGLGWSVQDGRLQILKQSATRPGEALLVSEDNGMVGSPAFGTPEKSGKPPTLGVRALVNPSFLPGGLVRVESDAVRGNFRIERVRHTGDTAGSDWYSDLELKQL